MKPVGSHEAKTHLPALLDRVAQGETITITKQRGGAGSGITFSVPILLTPPDHLDTD
jgi:hypothetical protein